MQPAKAKYETTSPIVAAGGIPLSFRDHWCPPRNTLILVSYLLLFSLLARLPSILLVLNWRFSDLLIHNNMSVDSTSLISGAETWSAYASYGFPVLTTFFEPPEECSTRWALPSGNSDLIVSGDPAITDFEEFGVETDYWTSCLPFRVATPEYSPGLCTAGQSLAEILELQFQASVIWQGLCCNR